VFCGSLALQFSYQPGQSRNCLESSKKKKMYEHVFQFFGLRENPFHISPDPRFFFCGGTHARALSQLTAGIETRQGLVVLVGEPGTGKTILLQHLLNWLQQRKQSSCYVFQSQLKPLELFEAVLHDFGVPCSSRRKVDMLAALNRWLIDRHSLHDSPVLIIDEAQAIWLRTLDQLRMLLNLETPGSKLLQIVLAGQEQLEEKLRRPELRQLQQRMMFRCSLEPLSLQGTSAYIKHRLTVCGAAHPTAVFGRGSVEAVQLHSEGIPRVVNLLCEHALLKAYVEKSRVVSAEMIVNAAEEFELMPPTKCEKERESFPEIDLASIAQPEKKTRAMAAALGETAHRTRESKSSSEKPFQASAIKKTKVQAPHPQPQESVLNQAGITEALRSDVLTAKVAKASPAFEAAGIPTVSPTESEAIRPQPLQHSAKPKPSRRLLENWEHSQLGGRFMRYWMEVGQSFVYDWKHFLENSAQRKPAGPRSSNA
jgi:general secretion pathway protein A